MKKRDLYHSSGVRCRQHHKDFDCTENDHMVRTTIFMSDDSRSVANSNNKMKHCWFGMPSFRTHQRKYINRGSSIDQYLQRLVIICLLCFTCNIKKSGDMILVSGDMTLGKMTLG